MAATFPVSAMMVGGTLTLGGVTPAMISLVIEGTTAGQWMGRLHLPVRILCEPDNPVRLHDLQWLVDTGGDLEADQVARALGDQIGAMVTATPVNAMHPDTE